jgi:hypothetical protein
VLSHGNIVAKGAREGIDEDPGVTGHMTLQHADQGPYRVGPGMH